LAMTRGISGSSPRLAVESSVRMSHGSILRLGEVSVRSVGLALCCEVGRVRSVLGRRWAHRGVRGYLLTAVIAAAVVLAWWADRTSGRSIVAMCCGEHVDAPLDISLLRLPGSLVAPAALLPVWGSVAQVVLAFGIAEAAVGARRALTVAAFAHVIGTLAGRYFVWYAPAVLGGLPTSWRYALDTGPSAATCGLAVYVAVLLGCPRLGGLLVIGVVGPFVLHPDLAGREHIVALAVGAIAAGGQVLAFRRAARHLATIPTAPTVAPALRA
jgi:hypothetical protein